MGVGRAGHPAVSIGATAPLAATAPLSAETARRLPPKLKIALGYCVPSRATPLRTASILLSLPRLQWRSRGPVLTPGSTIPPGSSIANEHLNASWPDVGSLAFDQNPNPLRTELFEEPV